VRKLDKSIGLVEYKTVPSGISAADKMVKTSQIEILEAQTVCPGKYIVLLSGSLSAVKAAVEAGIKGYEENVIDSFVLGNPHESIFRGISGTSDIKNPRALGIIETFSAASIIVAADICAKAARVDMVEIRIAKGMCGKSYLLMTGELAAVDAAAEAADKKLSEDGMLLDKSIVANPDQKLWEKLL
jgi:microcompartment protein CcmL/EutN